MNWRGMAKTLAAVAVHRSGVRSAIATTRRIAAGGRRVVVLGYHRVCDDFEAERQRGIESCLISRDTFRAHVEFLAERFELATMSRAVDVLARRTTATRDLAVITFDDGYRDVLENALPVLREARAPATLYVSSGVVDQAGFFPHDRLFALLERWVSDETMRQRASAYVLDALRFASRRGARTPKAWLYELIRHRTPAELERLCTELMSAGEAICVPASTAAALDWDGVRELQAGGVEIGAHTISHCVLTHLPYSEVEQELRRSREAIENEIGRPVRHFAYCNGYYNAQVIECLRRTGYASAVTTEDRLNVLGGDPYRIGRRVLWERSAHGPTGRVSASLLACQLDDAWSSLGFDSSESGEREALPAEAAPANARRPA